jgi:uncharacterized protein (DUF2252 family)
MKPINQARRADILAAVRAKKMARSAHAYVRGNTIKFYEWLESTTRCALPEGPPVWICGDCHVGNLGPLADKDGWVDIQIRDLDQTVIGNPAHDLVRLALSMAMAVRGSDLPGATTALMVEEMVKGYCEALSGSVSRKVVSQRQRDAVGKFLNQALRRGWRQLAEERIRDATPTIPKSQKFWDLRKTEAEELRALVESEELRGLITSMGNRKDDAAVKLLDAAYWIKGCSSLGRLRYAAILRVGKDKGLESDYCFLDLKEATSAAAPRAKDASMPHDNAERVVAGARALSPNLGERMLASRLSGRPIVVRELMPQDLKLEVDRLTQIQTIKLARYLSGVVGHAHARQLPAADRKRWKKELQRFSTRLDAPPWLWDSVVQLVAQHEAGYLEHCRKVALAA